MQVTMEWPVGVGGTQQGDCWGTSCERHSNTVYIFKLHGPTCAYVNVVVFSIIESIPGIVSPGERKSGPAPIMK